MKKNLLVTLADRNYIDQAKQLFSSVYFNSGWKGDYMLLAYEIPEKDLKWFKDKGILIYDCSPLFNKLGDRDKKMDLLISKYYLFTSYFKKWKNIIFLDGDIMVRASLNRLTKLKGFFASDNSQLKHRIITPFEMKLRGINTNLPQELKNKFDINKNTFCSGIMIFSTDIIKEDTFPKLKSLSDRYGKISSCWEELALILLFNNQRKRLLTPYTIVPHKVQLYCDLTQEEIKGIILHFCEEKPWIKNNFFYKGWNRNLNRANLIDLKKRPTAKNIWSQQEIISYDEYIKNKITINRSRKNPKKPKIKLFFKINKIFGRGNLFLKKYFPRIHLLIKKFKK